MSSPISLCGLNRLIWNNTLRTGIKPIFNKTRFISYKLTDLAGFVTYVRVTHAAYRCPGQGRARGHCEIRVVMVRAFLLFIFHFEQNKQVSRICELNIIREFLFLFYLYHSSIQYLILNLM